MTNDQLTFDNPVDRHPTITPRKQDQDMPGLDTELDPKADRGETSYRGTGRLDGRKALITGGDSGIGAAVAIAFAREGADVALNYLPAEEADAKTVVELIEAEGRVAVAIPGDITDRDFCESLVSTAVDGLGGLDILVNNAGKQQAVENLADLTTEQFDATFKTNVYATFWLTKAAVPHLPPGASIINSTSVVAYTPPPMLIDYASTKAAINTLTKGLAQQLISQGIRVNAVAPGPVWTPLQVSGGQPTEALPEFGSQSPMGRAGQPAELAPAYVFLASQESSYVNGETLNVNGGSPTP